MNRVLFHSTIFGPIHSRRLGTSLGINLLPDDGKICSFDCVYCEAGWNAQGTGTTGFPPREKVASMLEEKLRSMAENNERLDVITFSGNGEPSFHPEFPEIIDDVIALRNFFAPNAKVSVLSNATRVHRPEVFAALRKVDNPTMKIDAPTTALAEKINHPAPGYDINRVVEALKQFNGDFVLQTMFLKSKDFDSSSPEVLNGWMDIVRILKPREIMVYTIDRPTPEEGLQKFTVEEMRALVQPLLNEGFKIQIKG